MKIRGFEIAKGYEENQHVVLPHRKTKGSAGYDLTIVEAITLEPGARGLAKTGLKAYMQDNEVLEVYIRSSIGMKQGVWLPNSVGIIDADYYGNSDNDGHIMIALYNSTEQAITFQAGDRLAQAIFKTYLTIDGEDDQYFKTRTGGFGSTGV